MSADDETLAHDETPTLAALEQHVHDVIHADLDDAHGEEHPEGTCELCDWAGSIPDLLASAFASFATPAQPAVPVEVLDEQVEALGTEMLALAQAGSFLWEDMARLAFKYITYRVEPPVPMEALPIFEKITVEDAEFTREAVVILKDDLTPELVAALAVKTDTFCTHCGLNFRKAQTHYTEPTQRHHRAEPAPDEGGKS